MNFYGQMCTYYQPGPKRIQRLILTAGILLLLLISKALHMSGHDKDKKAHPPKVRTASVVVKDFPVVVKALGTVTPDYSITVRTQINGQLQKVHFKEGQLVKAGDLLAEIDSRTYDAQVLQYSGQLAKDTALLDNAKIDLERYKSLAKNNAVSKQILDTQLSLVHQNEGNVKSDQGLLDAAKLNQSYCKITAPVNGRVGFRFVDPGNYVQVSDPGGLVILNTISPIGVTFSLPGDYISDILSKLHANAQIPVEALDHNQKNVLATGILSVIDNQIDLTTGTFKLNAVFQNEKEELFPNQFVNIRFAHKIVPNAHVVPTVAVQKNGDQSFVYALDDQSVVHNVPVTVVAIHDDETAIDGKIAQNAHVIVEGIDMLRDGMSVDLAATKDSKPA